MKNTKKIMTLILALILAIMPIMVSAKEVHVTDVDSVGGILFLGNKGYSMNYLMQPLNETQMAEIRKDLNSSKYAYFKLSDKDTKWTDIFNTENKVDTATLLSQVGDNITLTDSNGTTPLSLIEDSIKAPNTFNTSGKQINFYDTTDYWIKSPVQLTKTNYRVQFWKVNATGNDELLFDTNNSTNTSNTFEESKQTYNVIDKSNDCFRVIYVYSTNVLDLALMMHTDSNMNIVTDLTRYGSNNLYRYALYVNDKLITCEDMIVPDKVIPYNSPEYAAWASKEINYSPVNPY